MPAANVWFRFIRKTFLLKKEEEEYITQKEIEDSIYFYGHNLWILFFSMIIACVGLNVNSAAAVIGAMLISPLMGPVIGIGFGLATHDFQMIGRSARHWIIALLISLLASTLYFLITPLDRETNQLGAFKNATLFDAMLAFFGGMAGFLGIAKKDGNKVLAGVAIATACMPPLCTAGYGIAQMDPEYIMGGFYFYIINCLFIGLGTLLLAKYMKFSHSVKPVKNAFLNKYGSTVAYVISFLGLIPCLFIFLNMMKEDKFKANAENFVSDISKNDYSIINKVYTYNKEKPVIELTFVGSESDHLSKDSLVDKLKKYVDPADLVLHYTNLHRNINEKDIQHLERKIRHQDSVIGYLKNKIEGSD